MLYLLTFAKDSALKKELINKYVNYLENINSEIIKSHYYSDVESWRKRIKNCSVDNNFLKDNIQYNEEHFNLKAINKEKINMEL